MADNQMVKIVFDFDLGNVPASAKKLSQYLKDNNLDLKFTKKSVDNLAASMNQLSTAQTKAAQAGATAGNSIKKSNQQWTNFALVIQDLPYGFRGIQNNLPALMGGIAGMAGPLYLVGSAIIALFTAWDAGLFKVKNATNALNDAQKQYNETLKSSMGSAGEEIAKMNALVSIAGNQEIAMDKRLSAVKKLQDEYPSYFGNLDKEKILNGDVSTAVDGVKSAIIQRAKATAVASKINKLSAEKFAKDEELYQLALQKTARVQAAVNFVKQFPSSAKHLKGLIDASIGGIREQENSIKSFVNEIDKELNRLQGIYTEAEGGAINLGDTGTKNVGLKQDKSLLNALKSEQQLYKDDMFMKRAIGLEILDEEERLAVEEAKFNKASNSTLLNIAKDFKNQRLAIEKETLDEIQKIRNDDADRIAKDEEKDNKERLDRGKKSYQDSIKSVSEFYQNKMNLATGDKEQQLSILKEQQSYWDILYGSGLMSYEDYAKKTGEITKEQIGLTNSLVKTSVEATMQLGMAIMSALAPAFDMMIEKGATIGEALQSVFTDLLKQLAKVIITAAIAVALMAALGLVKVGDIGKTFTMLFSQGMGFGKLGKAGSGGNGASQPMTMFDQFASGGIISGPTYGLMGEYPGAKSNPEVVAPLDKLKDMIGGGGGGTFMLRGQDLLLSVNRAQKASNLKGQNISLA